MQRSIRSNFIALAACLLALQAARPAAAEAGAPTPPQDLPKVWFNQHAIEGAQAKIDVNDPLAVFRLVFSQLADEVVVYPTENYYYYQFQNGGKTYWGNLRLDANDRDRGVLHLGYFQFNESGISKDLTGLGRPLTIADGVRLSKVDPWRYDVGFEGRTVRFRLNDTGYAPPQRARLRPGETYVGPVFDESGLRFHLIFDRDTRHFMYVLNEDVEVPEELIRFSDRVLIGRRSAFAFLDDSANTRKVLIAVHANNVNRNNYYDGPFDQLPDNYAERTQIQGFIEAAYPYMKGNIDRVGKLLSSNDTQRVAIAPYAVYSHMGELQFVDACAGKAGNEGSFYTCVTPDLQSMQMAFGPPVPIGEASVRGKVGD